MGAYYQGRCLTDSDATRQYFSSIPTVVDSSSSPPSVISVDYQSPDWLLVVRQSGVIVDSYPLSAPSFSPCSFSDSVVDGVALGFLVVGVWLAGYIVPVFLRVLGFSPHAH